MTTTVKRTLAALVLLAGVAACGSTDPSGTTPSGPPTTSTGPVATPPHDFAMARSVTMIRSGGLMGGKTTVVFAAHRPPPDGFTATDVTAVLRAASSPLLKTRPDPTPTNICCDRYVYLVTITWPDGTSDTLTTLDGSPQSPALTHLLRLMS
jgi:hypothetical protein